MGKRYDAKSDRGTNHLGRQFVKSSEFVDGSSATYIPAGDIVTISGVDGVYPTVERARDGVTDEDMLFIAAAEIRGGVGLIEEWQIISSVDTSSASAVGDPIYLSDATPGKWVITAPAGSPIKVGKVLVKDASAGVVLIRPLV